MTDVNKTEEKETSTQASEEKPEEEKTEETQEETQKESTEETSETIDYKAELEKANERLEKAENKIVRLKNQKDEETSDEETEEKPSEDIREIIKQELRGIKTDLNKESAKNYAGQMASSPEEVELIMFHYENSIVPTGNLREDMENAKLIANKKVILGENQLIRKALNNKTSIGQGEGGGQKKESSQERPKLSPQEEKLIGHMKWDGKRGGFVDKRDKFYPFTPR